MKGRGGQAGDHVAAHVSQADKVYSELIQSGVTVDGWRQSGETVYFRTPQPLPTHRRRSRWWVGSVGAVVAFFAVAGLLKAGVLAASVGVAMAGVLLFGGLFLLVWKISDRPGAGFIGTTIAGLVCAVLLIGALTSVEPMWDAGAAAQQASIAAECGGIGGGDIACRWQKLVESGERLAEVAQSPESEGLGTLLLGTLAVVIGGGDRRWLGVLEMDAEMTIRRFRRFSLRTWWRMNQPVRCAVCGRWLRLKDAQPAIHFVAGQVLLCVECDRRLHSWRG